MRAENPAGEAVSAANLMVERKYFCQKRVLEGFVEDVSTIYLLGHRPSTIHLIVNFRKSWMCYIF